MLLRARQLSLYAVVSGDQEIGGVTDLCFDFVSWSATRLVASAGARQTGEGAASVSVAAVLGLNEETRQIRVVGEGGSGAAAPPVGEDILCVSEFSRNGIGAVDFGRKRIPGYGVTASDGWSIGVVSDLIIDGETWGIRYLAVSPPGSWWPGYHALVPPSLVMSVEVLERVVHVVPDKKTLRGAPQYDPDAPLTAEFLSSLDEYYAGLSAAC